MSTDTPEAQTAVGNPERRRLIVSVLLLVLAAAALAGVLFFAGGLDVAFETYDKYIGGGDRLDGGSGTTTSTAGSTSDLTKADLEGAKFAYAEQIESQTNLDKLADGDVVSIRVDSVKVRGNNSLVNVTVKFKDGTSGPGGMSFRRTKGLWYFQSITGLRSDKTGGLADSIGANAKPAKPISADAKLAEAGVKTPDPGVLATLAEQTKINQPLFRDLMAGEYELYVLGKPLVGSQTFTIPVRISETGSESTTATIVLVAQTAEGVDRVFLTTFKKQ